jgi:hypothetical protein
LIDRVGCKIDSIADLGELAGVERAEAAACAGDDDDLVPVGSLDLGRTVNGRRRQMMPPLTRST